jgi:hypothetical protein
MTKPTVRIAIAAAVITVGTWFAPDGTASAAVPHDPQPSDVATCSTDRAALATHLREAGFSGQAARVFTELTVADCGR